MHAGGGAPYHPRPQWAGGVLGLDLAGEYGWAYIGPDGAYIRSNHARLRGLTYGGNMHRLRSHLLDMVNDFGPDVMVVEKPVSQHYNAQRFLFGMVAIAQLVAAEFGVTYTEMNRSQAYRTVIGQGDASKERGIAHCRQALRMDFENNNETDAILLAMAVQQRRSAGRGRDDIRSAPLVRPGRGDARQRRADQPGARGAGVGDHEAASEASPLRATA